MLNFFRSLRSKSPDSSILLRLSLMFLVAGGSLTGVGIWRLLSDEPVADGFGKAFAISASMLICGIGGLIHRWRLDRKQGRGGAV